MFVAPIVKLELVRLALPMLLRVLDDPEMVLLVNVSDVALPTNVSVVVGNVKVPEFTIELITGAVKVLFVKVCVPESVTTDESIPIVTGAEAL